MPPRGRVDTEDREKSKRVGALRDPEFRRRLLTAAAERSRDKLGGNLISRFDLLFEMADEPDYEPALETSIAAIAARTSSVPSRGSIRIAGSSIASAPSSPSAAASEPAWGRARAGQVAARSAWR